MHPLIYCPRPRLVVPDLDGSWRELDERRGNCDAAIGIGISPSMGGAPAAWTPASESDLFFWLRGDTLTLNGSDVASWDDKSGNGRHWTQGTPGHQPAAVAVGIGGMPSVQFDAANNEYLIGPDISALTAVESFLVVQLARDPTTNLKEGLWRVSPAAETCYYPYSGDGNIYDDFATTVRKATGNPTPNLASAHIYNVVSVANEWTSRFNGTQHYTTATNTMSFGTPAHGRYLGSAQPVGGLPLDGLIAEWILYSRKLETAERAAVHAYLGTRYTIAVA